MQNLELDERTAQELEKAAQSQNMTVSEFVRHHLLGVTSDKLLDAESVVDFESELDALVFSAPTLPVNFSRDDIYVEHD